MNRHGEYDLLVAARGALLDALEALSAHLNAVVVVGAQAVYLHTGAASVALAEATKDSDLALNVSELGDYPLLEQALTDAGFQLNPETGQPGSWVNAQGIPVDLMVPEAQAGASGHRGARIPPHAKSAARRALGLEAAVVDYIPTEIRALAADDSRVFTANVAGPAALLVAKLHKIGERQGAASRLVDKDAHDIYRLLVAVPTERLADELARLIRDPFAGPVTRQALTYLAELFAIGTDAPGSTMAGRAEQGVGEPATVAASATFLSQDLLAAVDDA
jgi:hypothetical protein